MRVDLMRVKIEGVTPMIIDNGQTANPLNSYAKKLKELTGKRNKSEEDIEKLLMVQWEAGLYWNDKIGLYMPNENMSAGFYKAAKKNKLGKSCSAVTFTDPLGFPIITKNHTDFQALKADPENKLQKIVVIQKAKTLSCRPIFKEWKMNFELEFENAEINPTDVKLILNTWSRSIGIGVWTPGSPRPGVHGKFIIESMTHINGKTKEEVNMI